MKQIGNEDLFPTEIEACSFVLNEGLCTRNIILICFYRFLNDAPIRLCFRLANITILILLLYFCI